METPKKKKIYLFKVNTKVTKTTLLTTFWCLIVNFENIYKYAFIFENIPEKLIWKPPCKFSQPKGQGRGRRKGQLWSISNRIMKVGVNATC